MHGHFIAKLPFRLRNCLYRRCHNDLVGEPMGFLTSLKIQPLWVRKTWKLVATGQDWGEEKIAEFLTDDVWALHVSDEPVSITELAWCIHRAQVIIDVASRVIGNTPGFELAAELSLEKQHKMVVKIIMANDINDRENLKLLETLHTLLSIVPLVD